MNRSDRQTNEYILISSVVQENRLAVRDTREDTET